MAKKNKTVKKKNTSKTIHQIFYNIGRGELKDIPAFNKCYQHNKKYCKKNGKKNKDTKILSIQLLLNDMYDST